MKRKDSTSSVLQAGEAAGQFVRFDAGEAGAGAELAAWIGERPENERALERVELAAELGRRLAADPQSRLYAEAAIAARSIPRRRVAASPEWLPTAAIRR